MKSLSGPLTPLIDKRIMKQNSLYDFVFFGTAFRYLQSATGAIPYAGNGYVRENIQFVLNFLVKNNMKVSKNAAWELENLLFEYDEYFQDAETDVLTTEQVGRLASIMVRLNPTVLAEALEVTAFFPSEKRYSVIDLSRRPEVIFGVDSFGRLPQNAKFDFTEACKCILVERGTAAAFHLMRGTEATLKHLYFSVVKKGRKKPAMWANMVQHLNERKALDEACKGMLDVFRKGFRNPTAHPEKVYTVEEAQDLLGTTIQLAALICSQKGYVAPPEEEIN